VVIVDQAVVVQAVVVQAAVVLEDQEVVILEVRDQEEEIVVVAVRTVVQEIERVGQEEDQVLINQDIEDVNTILF
jgi:hypothetical protein